MSSAPRKRKRFNNGKVTVAKLNKKVNKMRSKVEIKELNKIEVMQNTGGTDSAFTLNTLVRGNASNQRIGNKIYMKLLELKYRLKIFANVYNGTDTNINWTLGYDQDTVRVLVILDRQNNNGSSVVINEILENAGTQSQKIFSVYDYKFVDSLRDTQRYKILYDRVHYLSQNISQDINVRKFISLNHKVSFSDGNTGTATDIINNAIRIVFVPSLNNAEFGFSTNLWYSDT